MFCIQVENVALSAENPDPLEGLPQTAFESRPPEVTPLFGNIFTILLQSISQITGSDQGAEIVILLPQGATIIMSEKSDSLPTDQENVPEQGGHLRGPLSKTRTP